MAQDKVPDTDTLVSTVWLGLDFSYWPGGPIEIFETLVLFDHSQNRTESYGQRYSTEEEALEGHEKALLWACEALGIDPRLIPAKENR